MYAVLWFDIYWHANIHSKGDDAAQDYASKILTHGLDSCKFGIIDDTLGDSVKVTVDLQGVGSGLAEITEKDNDNA